MSIKSNNIEDIISESVITCYVMLHAMQLKEQKTTQSI